MWFCGYIYLGNVLEDFLVSSSVFPDDINSTLPPPPPPPHSFCTVSGARYNFSLFSLSIVYLRVIAGANPLS